MNKVSLRDTIMNGCLTCRHPSPRTLERWGVSRIAMRDKGSALDPQAFEKACAKLLIWA